MKTLAVIFTATFFAFAPLQVKANENVAPIVQAVVDTGWSYEPDHEICYSHKPRIYGFVMPNPRTFVICIDNHRYVDNPRAELVDTVKHEAIHVVQFCRKDLVFDPDKLLSVATVREKQNIARAYRPQFVMIELEATVGARVLPVGEIVRLIRSECN